MSRKMYTTIELAKAAGVPRATVQHWVKTGKISAPPVRLRRNRAVRLWTDAQRKRIQKLGGTFKSGPKKRAPGGGNPNGERDARSQSSGRENGRRLSAQPVAGWGPRQVTASAAGSHPASASTKLGDGMEPQERRSTVELIQELDAEAPKFTHVLLVVGFEQTTIFVRADDPNRLKALNEAVLAGGEPVGFIGLNVGNGHALFSRRTLKEFVTEEWADRYLRALIVKAAEALHQTNYRSTDGWLN
jgi:hypothetical protein